MTRPKVDLHALASGQTAAASPAGRWEWRRVGGNRMVATRHPSDREHTQARWDKFLSSSVPRYLSHGCGILGGIAYEVGCRAEGIEP